MMMQNNISSNHLDLNRVDNLNRKKFNHPLFTPPQSSKSSFAPLPSTSSSNHLTKWLSETFQAQRNSFKSNTTLNHLDPQSDIHLDDGDDDEEEEDDDEDDFEMDDLPVEEQFDGLSSLREPSPSGLVVFSNDDPKHFDVLDLNEARQIESALVSLSSPIASALTQYRSQFNQWELEPNLHDSVIRASNLIDQCLAKFVYSLEPFKWIVEDLFQFGCSLNQFSSFLSELDNENHSSSLETNTRLWNALSQLSDQSISTQAAFVDNSSAISDLCDWVDAELTPALAEVKFSTLENTVRVSQILDVHSYLCESLVKSCAILKVYLNCLKRIAFSIQKFQSFLSPSDDSEPQFPIHQANVWSTKWTASLAPLVNSLAVFHAMSACIQIYTAGRFSSNLTPENIASGHPDLFLFSDHSSSPSGNSSEFTSHSISYS